MRPEGACPRATTSTGSASLKLNRDPLGSPTPPLNSRKRALNDTQRRDARTALTVRADVGGQATAGWRAGASGRNVGAIGRGRTTRERRTAEAAPVQGAGTAEAAVGDAVQRNRIADAARLARRVDAHLGACAVLSNPRHDAAGAAGATSSAASAAPATPARAARRAALAAGTCRPGCTGPTRVTCAAASRNAGNAGCSRGAIGTAPGGVRRRIRRRPAATTTDHRRDTETGPKRVANSSRSSVLDSGWGLPCADERLFQPSCSRSAQS